MKDFNGFPCINGGELKARLGISISAAEIEAMGHPPYARDAAARFWRLCDLNKIIDSIKERLDKSKEAT